MEIRLYQQLGKNVPKVPIQHPNSLRKSLTCTVSRSQSLRLLPRDLGRADASVPRAQVP